MPQAILVQLDIVWEAAEANRRRIASLLEDLDIAPGALIVLPEMCTAGFSMNVAAIAQGPGGDNAAFFAGLAQQYQSWVLAGLVHRDAKGSGLNQAVAFDPSGREVARYTKMYPFTFAGESEHFTRGAGIVTFDWQGLTVAPFICFDLRFPEVFRAAAWEGVDVFTVIANFPTARHEQWACLTRARAIENQAYVLAVNRAGDDPNVAYQGGSRAIDPMGKVTGEGGDTENILTCDVDPSYLRTCRERFPVLRDMRGAFIAPGRANPESTTNPDK
jgi:predicted amidohydrolase